MATVKPIETEDTGIVIYDIDTNKYWCNNNKWSPNIRFACIYHSENYVNQVFEKFPDKHLATAQIQVRITKFETMKSGSQNEN